MSLICTPLYFSVLQDSVWTRQVHRTKGPEHREYTGGGETESRRINPSLSGLKLRTNKEMINVLEPFTLMDWKVEIQKNNDRDDKRT